MEYERIYKVQTGVISPSKLRMKILGAHKSIKKGVNNSSRTSPTKNADIEYVKNCLLDCDPDEAKSEGIPSVLRPANAVDGKAESSRGNQNVSRNFSYQHHPPNLSTIHPLKNLDKVCNLHVTGNGNSSTSSFNDMERAPHSLLASFPRQVPSKWNDAEKWIPNKQKITSSAVKKEPEQHQEVCQIATSSERIGPNLDLMEHWLHIQPVNRTELSGPPTENMAENVAFFTQSSSRNSVGSCNFPYNGRDFTTLPSTMEKRNHQPSLAREKPFSDPTVARPGENVSMRDIGTEMTPIPTPLGSVTPTLSPVASVSSTPRGGVASSSTEAAIDKLNIQGAEGLSERELKLKTRREIAALGVRLGKTNIATWASKEETIHSSLSTKIPDVYNEKVEYEARAAAWMEARNSEHQARYKREEVKIQAWESHQKEKFEAEMKTIEGKQVQMRAHAMEQMSEKLVLIQKQAEEKEAAARARMNKRAERIASKADGMRRTGKLSSSNFLCCNCYF